MPCTENRTYHEIAIGESASLTRTLSARDIELFAVISGKVDSALADEAFTKNDICHKILAHSIGSALISAVLCTELPGPGTVYVGQTLRFRRPISLGDTMIVRVTTTGKDAARLRVIFDCEVANQKGKTVIEGTAVVIAPKEKIFLKRVPPPRGICRKL